MRELIKKLDTLKEGLFNLALLAEEIQIEMKGNPPVEIPKIQSEIPFQAAAIVEQVAKDKVKTANHKTIKAKKIYAQGEVAAFLGMHTSSVAIRAESGQIPFHRKVPNGYRKFIGQDIINFLKNGH